MRLFPFGDSFPLSLSINNIRSQWDFNHVCFPLSHPRDWIRLNYKFFTGQRSCLWKLNLSQCHKNFIVVKVKVKPAIFWKLVNGGRREKELSNFNNKSAAPVRALQLSFNILPLYDRTTRTRSTMVCKSTRVWQFYISCDIWLVATLPSDPWEFILKKWCFVPKLFRSQEKWWGETEAGWLSLPVDGMTLR